MSTNETPQASLAVLHTLRVAMDHADFNYRVTGLKDHEIKEAREWVRAAIAARTTKGEQA